MDNRTHRKCCVCHVIVPVSDKHAACVQCLGAKHATQALLSADYCKFCADIDIRGLQQRLTLANAKAATPGDEPALPPSGTARVAARRRRNLAQATAARSHSLGNVRPVVNATRSDPIGTATPHERAVSQASPPLATSDSSRDEEDTDGEDPLDVNR